MKCEEFELIMIDYLDNTLDDARCLEVDKHISSCERCRDEVNAFQDIFQSISASKMEQPDETLKINFYHMLKSEMDAVKVDGEDRTKKHSIRLWPSSVLKIAAGIALIISGAFLSYIIYQSVGSSSSSARLGYKNDQGKEKNEMAMFTLLNEESPSQRIKALNDVEDNESLDPKVLNALIRVLNNDQNVNVRIAAAYTLSKYLKTPMVRDSIVESLGKQTEPVIQIVLMNILTEKMEKKAVTPMQEIISNKNTMEQVKFTAEKSINVLL